MGGIGALLTVEKYPDDVDGIILIAPYLGRRRSAHSDRGGATSRRDPGQRDGEGPSTVAPRSDRCYSLPVVGLWWCLPLLACVAACAPSVVAPSDGTTSTASSSESSSSTSAPPTDTSTTIDPDTTTTTTTDDTTGDTTDADLCVQWCINAEIRGCAEPYLGETCYTRCLDSIMYAELDGCTDEQRDILACEGLASPPAEFYCEAAQCEEVYIQHDLCRGSCSHLGGNQGGGSSQTDCNWRGTSCYGHDLEAVCPVGDAAALCDCIVDGAVAAQCEVGVALEAFECAGEDIQLLTSCCRETFEGVLLP